MSSSSSTCGFRQLIIFGTKYSHSSFSFSRRWIYCSAQKTGLCSEQDNKGKKMGRHKSGRKPPFWWMRRPAPPPSQGEEGVRSSRPHNIPRRGGLSFTRENIRLTEVLTIYEKLTKSRDRGDSEGEDDRNIFRSSDFQWLPYGGADEDAAVAEAAIPWEDVLKSFKDKEKSPPPGQHKESANLLDFNKYRDILKNQNYSYFSAATGLVQADSLEFLKFEDKDNVKASKSSEDLLTAKHYCIHIASPSESDLALLGSQFHVHDLTLRDIKEAPDNREKIEVFRHYTFVSLKSSLDVDVTQKVTPRSVKLAKPDVDLNILLFPECAIILGEQWTGFKDMLGFLNLLTSYGKTELTPDWVLFSIFIELSQDAKFFVRELEPKVLNMKLTDNMLQQQRDGGDNSSNTSSSRDLANYLARNFDNEFEIYKIGRFIKPKIKVLKALRYRFYNRVNPSVLALLSGTRKELEELEESLELYSHMLERCEDTCLTLASVRQTEEANLMGKSMRRISEVALIFLPLQAVTGFMGMNVKVPYQDALSTLPFWGILATSSVAVIFLYTSVKGVAVARNKLVKPLSKLARKAMK